MGSVALQTPLGYLTRTSSLQVPDLSVCFFRGSHARFRNGTQDSHLDVMIAQARVQSV